MQVREERGQLPGDAEVKVRRLFTPGRRYPSVYEVEALWKKMSWRKVWGWTEGAMCGRWRLWEIGNTFQINY